MVRIEIKMNLCVAIIPDGKTKWPFPILKLICEEKYWWIQRTTTVKFSICAPCGWFLCVHLVTTSTPLSGIWSQRWDLSVCGTFPVTSPVLWAKHWPCDLCSWPLACDVDPLSRGMGPLYISTGRFHWLPARHLLWEMKPRRMPLLGAFQAEQTTRPGLSPASE